MKDAAIITFTAILIFTCGYLFKAWRVSRSRGTRKPIAGLRDGYRPRFLERI
jgi:hypothetical protein